DPIRAGVQYLKIVEPHVGGAATSDPVAALSDVVPIVVQRHVGDLHIVREGGDNQMVRVVVTRRRDCGNPDAGPNEPGVGWHNHRLGDGRLAGNQVGAGWNVHRPSAGSANSVECFLDGLPRILLTAGAGAAGHHINPRACRRRGGAGKIRRGHLPVTVGGDHIHPGVARNLLLLGEISQLDERHPYSSNSIGPPPSSPKRSPLKSPNTSTSTSSSSIAST